MRFTSRYPCCLFLRSRRRWADRSARDTRPASGNDTGARNSRCHLDIAIERRREGRRWQGIGRIRDRRVGLHIIYPRRCWRRRRRRRAPRLAIRRKSTPVRSGASHVRPIHVAELLDGASALSILLESAQFGSDQACKPRRTACAPAVVASSFQDCRSRKQHVKKIDERAVGLGRRRWNAVCRGGIESIKASFL